MKSNKKDNDVHGIGTKILKNIAEKYEGDLKVYEENEFFCSSIIIKMPSVLDN